MGKGTGTGASPVVARIAREMGILTIAVVTYPYKLEQKRCWQQADEGIAELRKYVDSIIIIQNQKVMETYRRETLPAALAHADDVLKNAVKCIAELITISGYQNVDFNDVASILTNSGEAMLGLAEASGENRIEEVISKAMTCNLIDDCHITDAQNFLFFVRYGEEQELTVDELFKLSEEFEKYQNADTRVIWGHAADKGLGDKLKLSVIITKYNANTLTAKLPSESEHAAGGDKVIPIIQPRKEDPAPVVAPRQEDTATPVIIPQPENVTTPEIAPRQEDSVAPVISPIPEDEVAPIVSPEQKDNVTPSFSEPTLFDPMPSDDIVDGIIQPSVNEPEDNSTSQGAASATPGVTDTFDSDFFKQPNVPEPAQPSEPVMPSLLKEGEDGNMSVIRPVVHPKPNQVPDQGPAQGIVVTDNGDTVYENDEEFDDLVNTPAYAELNGVRIINVQTPAMQRTAQPAYTTQRVFFGLDANAD